MINLFHINHYNIDTSKFDHVLNGSIVSDFEKEFCKYVGADYACGVNSATNAIFLSLLGKEQTVSIPSIIPYVVLNAITLGGNNIRFTDDDAYLVSSAYDNKINLYEVASGTLIRTFSEHSDKIVNLYLIHSINQF